MIKAEWVVAENNFLRIAVDDLERYARKCEARLAALEAAGGRLAIACGRLLSGSPSFHARTEAEEAISAWRQARDGDGKG